jgi:hypothetical protein
LRAETRPHSTDWPNEDQDALVEAARVIEAERTALYQASAAELALIDRHLCEAARGSVRWILRPLPKFAPSFVASDLSPDGGRARRLRAIKTYQKR